MGCGQSDTGNAKSHSPRDKAPKNKKGEGKTLWLTGYPTAGKTWIADFLEMYHNYIHVDGDEFVSLWT